MRKRLGFRECVDPATRKTTSFWTSVTDPVALPVDYGYSYSSRVFLFFFNPMSVASKNNDAAAGGHDQLSAEARRRIDSFRRGYLRAVASRNRPGHADWEGWGARESKTAT